jgi:hypothetical protein
MKKFENLGKSLTRQEQKMLTGATSCSGDCPAGQSASITNCNGTCTGGNGYATCQGATAVLTKRCSGGKTI